MRSRRTQKSLSIGTEKSAPGGRDPRDKTTLLLDGCSANGDLFSVRADSARLTDSFRLTDDTERTRSERAIRIAPTILLAGLAALAVLIALGVLELALERVLSDAVALSVPVIFGSIAAAGITYFALRRHEASYRRTLEAIAERERAENAQREAERKYRDIFENAVEGIFQTSPDGGFITANPALALMMGFASPEELIRARDIDGTYYVHPERRVEFKRLLGQHDTVRGFEFEAYRKDGTKIWMSDNVRAVRDASGKLLYYEGTTEDITERKRAEEELRSAKEFSEKLIQTANVIVLGLDMKARINIFNQTAEKITGYTFSELEGKSWFDTLVPRERYPHVWEEFGRLVVSDNMPSTFENPILTKNGEERYIAWRNSQVSVDGKVVGIISFGNDVTERKQVEIAQREAERKYRDIFENAVEGIFQTTPAGAFIAANPALAHMLGYESPEELIRERRDIALQGYVDPNGREKFQRLLEKRDTVAGFEHQVYRKDRTKIWMSENVRAVRDASGKLQYYEGTIEDITERKHAEEALRKSEERYRELFENDKDAIYVHDLNGVYRSVNRAAESLSGYPREEIIGKHFRDFVSPEYLRQVGESFGKKLEETGETNYEVEIINRGGARVPVEVSSRLIYENGIAVGVQGSVRDITERKRAQQALLTYSRRLLEAQEAERGRIARELHDQIGQMLTALKLNLHVIQGAGDAGAAKPLIEDNLKMLDEAIEQVRDLSVDLRPLLLDDLGLVTALHWFVDHQAQRTGVRAEFTSDSLNPDLRFSAELETACFRIAQEALTNIARHARAKTVTVRLSRNRDYLILLVEDDGAGFDIKALQGHAPANATLGLRGMEERVHAVGGRIKIDSAIDRGTQVFVELPIAMPNGGKPRTRDE
jgi:PAS domain S-box-containing protein